MIKKTSERKMKNLWTKVLLLLAVFSLFFQVEVDSFGVVEVTEVISVVRIGVSLVEYIYKVFSSILVKTFY
jgi:hypothetical protein